MGPSLALRARGGAGLTANLHLFRRSDANPHAPPADVNDLDGDPAGKDDGRPPLLGKHDHAGHPKIMWLRFCSAWGSAMPVPPPSGSAPFWKSPQVTFKS